MSISDLHRPTSADCIEPSIVALVRQRDTPCIFVCKSRLNQPRDHFVFGDLTAQEAHDRPILDREIDALSKLKDIGCKDSGEKRYVIGPNNVGIVEVARLFAWTDSIT